MEKLFITICTILLISMTACSTQEETIELGATLALSGKFAFLGQEEVRGLELAADEINAQGGINGKKLVIIPEDNKGDAKEAVTNVNKLINVDNVDLIFSAFTHITSAVIDPIKENNKFLIYASSVPDFAEQYQYAFRDHLDGKDHGSEVAKTLASKGITQVKFLSEISDVGARFDKGFEEETAKQGITIVQKEAFQPEEKDLKVQLLKLDLENGDVIVSSGWRHAHILMKDLKELNLDVQTYNYIASFLPVADSAEVRALYEENNLVSTWYGMPEVTEKEIHKRFIEKYKAKYDELPRADSAYAYDDVMLLAESIENCGSVDMECMKNYMISNTFDGVGGQLSFDHNGVSKRDVLLITVQNGSWVEI